MNRFRVLSAMVTGTMVFACVLMVNAAAPPKLEVGTKVPTFSLKDAEGKEYTLEQYLGDKVVAIMFIATQCPVSNAYNERMRKLCEDYSGKGVAFIAVNSNKRESVEEIRDHAKKNGFQFPVLKDVDNIVADSYGAEVTPEIFLVADKGILRYHGRIDDNREVSEVTSQDLRAAIDALLSGKDVPRPQTKAFGCSIKRVSK
jgi:peroxiredoxin